MGLFREATIKVVGPAARSQGGKLSMQTLILIFTQCKGFWVKERWERLWDIWKGKFKSLNRASGPSRKKEMLGKILQLERSSLQIQKWSFEAKSSFCTPILN